MKQRVIVGLCLLVIAAAAGVFVGYQFDVDDDVEIEVSADVGERPKASSVARVRNFCIPRGRELPHDKNVFERYEESDFDIEELEKDLVLGDEIRLTLFEAYQYCLTVTRQMKTKGRYRVFLASSRGKNGRVHAIFLQKSNGLVAFVTDDGSGNCFLLQGEGGCAAAGKLVVAVSDGCGYVSEPLDLAKLGTPKKIDPERLEDGSAVVDVLVAQDSRSVKYASELDLAPDEFAELTVQKANAVLEDCGLLDEFALRLVHTVELGASAGGDVGEVLGYASSGKMLNGIDFGEKVCRAREEYGADIVAVLMQSDSCTVGVSYGMSPNTYLHGVERAYCVSDAQCAMSNYTMVHEIGHIFGAGHSDEQECSPGPQLFNFSAGCYGGDWRSVMSYAKEGHDRRIGRFSSPEISNDDRHDNVRTIRLTYAIVSGYRKSKEHTRASLEKSLPVAEPESGSSSEENESVVVASADPEGGLSTVEIAHKKDKAKKSEARSRKRGKSTVSVQDFANFVHNVANGEPTEKIVATLPAGAVLNFDAKLMAEEFKASRPDVVTVMTDFLPDGVSLVQRPDGSIASDGGNDAAAEKAGLLMKLDDNGMLSGKFCLTYESAEGSEAVDVQVTGMLVGGEAAGVAAIENGNCGPWYVTIAPEAAEPAHAAP